MATPLDRFSQPVREWFLETYGEPTPPQTRGWPPIQRGENALILAPTGSGKTLAAFLWALDRLSGNLAGADDRAATGLRLVYVSPLKALGNDIHRNLRVPLAGIRHYARSHGLEAPEIRVALRTGDTPSRERRAIVNRPPHILITTPESLYLMLTSPRARDIFRTVETVIVDEIHTLAGNKRGVHLALSLERLERIASRDIQRIGLSATIRPLDEVARFLGGNRPAGEAQAAPEATLVPRPVTVVEASHHKAMDLKVEMVVDDFRSVPGGSIWPVLTVRLVELIREHQTTLIFANNRRLAERTADRLNEQLAAEERGEESGLIEGGVVKGSGFMGAGRGTAPQPIRAHHGSMAREARLSMERDLKAGKLPALVGTSSLELGIDIGSVDLVVQLQSPKNVAAGLQRVGRSGHLVGQTSKGRIFPTHREDLMEAAVIAAGMLQNAVESTKTPANALDVLAQQIVAMVSVEPWDVPDLFNLIRRAYPYQDLTPRALHAVLDMLSGRYPSLAHGELRARIVWDRTNNKLASLPGSRLLATTNGGTIPDHGSYGVYLPDGKTRIGELDEEFVFETRVGDTFMLGSQVWRVLDITDDRLVVSEAPGAPPRMPFWNGDYPWRPYELGRQVGTFRRLVEERLRALQQELREELDLEEVGQIRRLRAHPAVRREIERLRAEHALDESSAWQVLDYIAQQLDRAGVIASDRMILVETFEDALGDPRLVVHSPFGGRVNGPWGLALAGALQERTGVKVEAQSGDDGILLRFPESDARFPVDLIQTMGPGEARRRILAGLPGSAVFGAQFRQNAARALLLPGLKGRRRTPFWLQRLRAKDLLQAVGRFEDFPLVAETYRDCLEDVMDLPHLEEVLGGIADGNIQVRTIDSVTPSPVAQSLLWSFASIYLYEWDTPRGERQMQTIAVSPELLQDLLKDVSLDELIRPEALAEAGGRAAHTAPGTKARTAEELAVLLEEMGDLTTAEVSARAAADPRRWLGRLAEEGRIAERAVPTGLPGEGGIRWIPVEYLVEYELAFAEEKTVAAADDLATAEGGGAPSEAARRRILERFLRHAGPVRVENILERYRFPPDWLAEELDRLVAERGLIRGALTQEAGAAARQDGTGEGGAGFPGPTLPSPPPTPPAEHFLDARTMEQARRQTLSLLRREVRPVPLSAYADFLTCWQHLAAGSRLPGPGGLTAVLQQLRAYPVFASVWERDVFPLRLEDHYDPVELEALCRSGEVIWVASGGAESRWVRVRFLFRGEGAAFLEDPVSPTALSTQSQAVYALLREEGALFTADIHDILQLPEGALETALGELARMGLVTNDSLQTLRRITTAGEARSPRPDGGRRFSSSLESDLAARMRSPGWQLRGRRRPSRTAYYAARRRVRARLEPDPPPPSGRWYPLHRLSVMGRELDPTERAGRQSRQLLLRHGVVTRASLEREEGSWDWGAISQQLQRMEMRGEVRRGYFIRGLPGLQYALPEAVEMLRTTAAEAVPGQDSAEHRLVLMNACDPANVLGPGRRIPSNWLVQDRGLPLLLVEDAGTRLTVLGNAPEETMKHSVKLALSHLSHSQRAIRVESWNGEPVLSSEGPELLESLGLYRDPPFMRWDRTA